MLKSSTTEKILRKKLKANKRNTSRAVNPQRCTTSEHQTVLPNSLLSKNIYHIISASFYMNK